jgi:MHS family proline/betaine transporter-like MFS transporter
MDKLVTNLPKLAIASALGTALEYFDYTLYGFSAPLIATLFFPTHNHNSAILLAWAVFFISYLIRPFGALLFGHWGDRIGRRKALSITIILMALPTGLIGLLPIYNSAGMFAPILLIACRILQGFAVSGEFAGCSVYLYEITQTNKGFFSSITTCAGSIGIIASSLWVFCFAYFNFNSHFIQTNYWRTSFIMAGFLIAIAGYYLRKNMPETPDFVYLQKKQKIHKIPFMHILKQRSIALLISIALAAYTSFVTCALLVYMADYLKTNLHQSLTASLLITAFVGLIEALAALLFAYLSDLIGRLKVMLSGIICILLFAVPLFQLMQNNSLFMLVFSLILLACCLAAVDGPMAAYIIEQFQISERYSGLGVSYNLGVGILGGAAPLILTYLIEQTHNALIPGLFIAVLAVIVLLSLTLYTYWKKYCLLTVKTPISH